MTETTPILKPYEKREYSMVDFWCKKGVIVL